MNNFNDMTVVLTWVAENFEKMSMIEQITVASKFTELYAALEPIYKRYNKPQITINDFLNSLFKNNEE